MTPAALHGLCMRPLIVMDGLTAISAQVLLRTPVGDLQINSPLVGRHNVYNILAAVATGLATTVRGKPVPLKARRALV